MTLLSTACLFNLPRPCIFNLSLATARHHFLGIHSRDELTTALADFVPEGDIPTAERMAAAVPTHALEGSLQSIPGMCHGAPMALFP